MEINSEVPLFTFKTDKNKKVQQYQVIQIQGEDIDTEMDMGKMVLSSTPGHNTH